MKKICILLFLLLFINSEYVKAEQIEINYDDAIKMVQEVMKQYYIRGPYIQYNYAKAEYYNLNPEDATSQDNKYTVCAGFTHNVYNQAFGILGKTTFMSGDNTFKDSAFPQYNYHLVSAAQSAYQKIKNKKINDDGTLLLYYQSTKDCNYEKPTDNIKYCKDGDGYIRNRETVKYVYGDNDPTTADNDFETLVSKVKPGDLFVYSGHALIAYDVVDNDGDNIVDDVLLLNAYGKKEIISRIESTASLYYDAFSPTNNILNVVDEGAIQFTLLSSQKKYFFDEDNKLNCQKAECAVIRPFYKDANGNAIFNFGQTPKAESVDKSLLRTQYPGLLIEKTVSKGDNNSVNIGDELTYSIKITNTGNYSYGEFVVEETLDPNVECVDCEYYGWTVNDNKQNSSKTIKMNYGVTEDEILKPGYSVTLVYTVKIKNYVQLKDDGVTLITSEGYFSNSALSGKISTGVVNNIVVPKVDKLTKTYQECYNSMTGDVSGLALINQIYQCVTDNNFHINFEEFDFENLFIKDGSSKTNATIKIDNTNQFKNMILNNYFSGLAIYTTTKETDTGSKIVTKYFLPRWNKYSSERAKTINPNDFKDGDVLIYDISQNDFTYESGLYAYIYINGKFVGVNYPDSIAMRNEFSPTYHTYEYWKNLGFSKYLTVKDSLYKTNWTDTTSFEKKFINYQSLYGKDNYVILRPELVIKEISGIEVLTSPNKKSYIQNYEELDLTGGKIKVRYNDTTTETIDMTNENVEVRGFDNSIVGNKTITVLYGDATATFDVTILAKTEYSINFGTYKTTNDKILVWSSLPYVSYNVFINNISVTGASYKVFKGDTEIQNLNITNGMILRVYDANKAIIDTYEICFEYIIFELPLIEEQSVIIGLKPGDTKTNLAMVSTGIIKVFDLKGKEVDAESKIGTGYQLVVDLISEKREYLLSVKGDITGDGKSTIGDVMKLANHILDKSTIKGDCYLKAGDITGDGIIKLSDVMKLANDILIVEQM